MKNHIHCIICGEPHEIDTEDWYISEIPAAWICNACAHSFDSQYLIHRIQCYKEGVHKPEFDTLEWRLTWGSQEEHAITFKDHGEIFL